MKAIVITKYGPPDVLKLETLKKPTPKDNEVLIKIQAASLNAADWHIMRGEPFFVRLMVGGLTKPKNNILGSDIAGEVEAIGKDVTHFKVGDEVFGDLSECGWGACAEYVAAPENALVKKPINMTFEEAAAVPLAGITALQGLRDKGHIQSGHKVLIIGASSGVGTFAVQIAKTFEAEVTAVCSTSKMDIVRSIGADHIIDYTKEDFTQNEQEYDLILDIAAYHSFLSCRRLLNSKGIYIMVGGAMTQFFQIMLLGPWLSMTSSKKMGVFMAKPNQNDLVFMKELLEDNKILPIIDKRYKLSKTPEAIRYLEERHARGKVVITLENNS